MKRSRSKPKLATTGLLFILIAAVVAFYFATQILPQASTDEDIKTPERQSGNPSSHDSNNGLSGSATSSSATLTWSGPPDRRYRVFSKKWKKGSFRRIADNILGTSYTHRSVELDETRARSYLVKDNANHEYGPITLYFGL